MLILSILCAQAYLKAFYDGAPVLRGRQNAADPVSLPEALDCTFLSMQADVHCAAMLQQLQEMQASAASQANPASSP